MAGIPAPERQKNAGPDLSPLTGSGPAAQPQPRSSFHGSLSSHFARFKLAVHINLFSVGAVFGIVISIIALGLLPVGIMALLAMSAPLCLQ
jgi:hypothetical protein